MRRSSGAGLVFKIASWFHDGVKANHTLSINVDGVLVIVGEAPVTSPELVDRCVGVFRRADPHADAIGKEVRSIIEVFRNPQGRGHHMDPVCHTVPCSLTASCP